MAGTKAGVAAAATNRTKYGAKISTPRSVLKVVARSHWWFLHIPELAQQRHQKAAVLTVRTKEVA